LFENIDTFNPNLDIETYNQLKSKKIIFYYDYIKNLLGQPLQTSQSSSNIIFSDDNTYNSNYIDIGTIKIKQYRETINSSIKMNTGKTTYSIGISDVGISKSIGETSKEKQDCFYKLIIQYNKDFEDDIEFILQDVTDSIYIENIKNEFNHKKLMLAKIAHEFKSPISTIAFVFDQMQCKLDKLDIDIFKENKVLNMEERLSSQRSQQSKYNKLLKKSNEVNKDAKEESNSSDTDEDHIPNAPEKLPTIKKINTTKKSLIDNKNNSNSNFPCSFVINLCDYLLMLVEDLNTFVKSTESKTSNEITDIKVMQSIKEKNQTKFKPVNLIKTLEFCHSIFFFKQKYDTIKQNLDIELKIEKDIGEIIKTNEIKLKQIIVNLLSNAYKFTAFGKIILKAEKVKKIKSNEDSQQINVLKDSQMNEYTNYLRISIKDTGSGINRKEQGLLFKEYIVLDRNQNLNKNGSGLGLVIVKEMITHLNSSINGG